VEQCDGDCVYRGQVGWVTDGGPAAGHGVPLVRVLVLDAERDVVAGELAAQRQLASDDADLVGHDAAGARGDVGGLLGHHRSVWSTHGPPGHVSSMSDKAPFSAAVILSCQKCFTAIQSVAYSHQKSRLAGFHCDGSWSPLARLDVAETARNCGRVRSF